MQYNLEEVKKLKTDFKKVKDIIRDKLSVFKKVWQNGNDEDIFLEFVFCIFTPQSKAVNCWAAVEELKERNLIFKGKPEEIAEVIGSKVRFKNNKAGYLVEAREFFRKKGGIKKYIESGLNDIRKLRDDLAKSVKGIGFKEASHFLRNIGFGEKLAILDRHILKNLVVLGVINEIPKTLSEKKYKEIEKKLEKFSEYIGIRMDYIDLTLWYREAGHVFK
jgi:N-glycosylase/DNA lyase